MSRYTTELCILVLRCVLITHGLSISGYIILECFIGLHPILMLLIIGLMFPPSVFLVFCLGFKSLNWRDWKFLEDYYEFRVIADQELIDWVKDNIKGQRRFFPGVVAFARKSDAALFSLYCGQSCNGTFRQWQKKMLELFR